MKSRIATMLFRLSMWTATKASRLLGSRGAVLTEVYNSQGDVLLKVELSESRIVAAGPDPRDPR